LNLRRIIDVRQGVEARIYGLSEARAESVISGGVVHSRGGGVLDCGVVVAEVGGCTSVVVYALVSALHLFGCCFVPGEEAL